MCVCVLRRSTEVSVCVRHRGVEWVLVVVRQLQQRESARELSPTLLACLCLRESLSAGKKKSKLFALHLPKPVLGGGSVLDFVEGLCLHRMFVFCL